LLPLAFKQMRGPSELNPPRKVNQKPSICGIGRCSSTGQQILGSHCFKTHGGIQSANKRPIRSFSALLPKVSIRRIVQLFRLIGIWRLASYSNDDWPGMGGDQWPSMNDNRQIIVDCCAFCCAARRSSCFSRQFRVVCGSSVGLEYFAMWRTLIKHVRTKHALKRGRSHDRIELCPI